MAAKPFASSADLGVKEQTLEVLADGVYALTAEGDPNLGAIESGMRAGRDVHALLTSVGPLPPVDQPALARS